MFNHIVPGGETGLGTVNVFALLRSAHSKFHWTLLSLWHFDLILKDGDKCIRLFIIIMIFTATTITLTKIS